MSELAKKLETIRAGFESQAPESALKVMKLATQALRDEELVKKALGVGDTFPEFSLKNSQGVRVHSEEILKSGPLVLSVFRGTW